MRRGDHKTIVIDDVSMEAEYLGKGHYTTAYLVGTTVYCFTVEDEYMKDVICDWCDDMTHIPKITSHDDVCIKEKYFKVYSMPYYRDITKNDKAAWAIYKTLKSVGETTFIRFNKPLRYNGLYFFQHVINELKGKVPESVILALSEMLNAACNFGFGVTIEFGKRNIGVDDNGNIIFRDILFDAEKLYKERVCV